MDGGLVEHEERVVLWRLLGEGTYPLCEGLGEKLVEGHDCRGIVGSMEMGGGEKEERQREREREREREEKRERGETQSGRFRS